VRALQALLERARLPLEVRTGGELGAEDVAELTDAQLELLAQGPPAHRWLLLEAPLVSVRRPFADAAAELRSRGYDVLVGHPERSPQTSLEDIEAAVAEGSVLQLNASSLVGVHGTVMRDKGLAIARSGLPFVVASDAHSPARPPLLTPAAETLRAAGLDPALIALAVDDGPPLLLDEGLAEQTRSATALSGR
jgi:protein-tyrosine phosphatase